uniref:(California timema) hypothetical protein n=1 Tax=Timema californicum TaxID=61474 RepID=A0A7R9PB06_TIMCA|nr:unnamed protein product [Timema californicum]
MKEWCVGELAHSLFWMESEGVVCWELAHTLFWMESEVVVCWELAHRESPLGSATAPHLDLKHHYVAKYGVKDSVKQDSIIRCWVAATTEAFLTWGLLGAALMQISSHNKNKHLLNRDASLVIVLTLSVLMLAAFLANTCVQLLKTGGYTYMPSSFVHPTEIGTSISPSSAVELQHDKRISQLRHRGGPPQRASEVGDSAGRWALGGATPPMTCLYCPSEHMSSYSFLHSDRSSSPIHLTSTPVRFMGHSQFVVGSQVVQPGANSAQQSGYQALRLATEIVPATLALLGSGQASPFWAVLFYFTLILFGIAQQLCIWHCVITGIMAINVSSLKAWETTITFFSCACGFILGLPMTTELGIFVVYFLDYCVGSAWWIMILYLLEIAAVLFVRGRPYTGDVIVTALLPPETSCLTMWATPMLVFNWNVALPVGLMVLCITVFKNAQLRDLYSWHHLSYDYWPLWAREAGCLVQLVPILTVPFAIIIQSCRYLSAGPPDLFDRISLLYRPSQETVSEIRNDPELSPTAASPSTASTVIPHIGADPVLDDPPPKYTPPPSYTTATGARIAKMLRQSFRRSVRRIASVLGEHSNSVRPTTAISPPDYAAVLVEINQALQFLPEHNMETRGGALSPRQQMEILLCYFGDPVLHIVSKYLYDPISWMMIKTKKEDLSYEDYVGQQESADRDTQRVTSPTEVSVTVTDSAANTNNRQSTMTAADVAHILRSSLRRTVRRGAMAGPSESNDIKTHSTTVIADGR